MPELVNYTVVVGAVTVATGKTDPKTKKPEVIRAQKGATFDAPSDLPAVLNFLDMKAIRRTAEATGNEHVTARTIVKAFRDEVEGNIVDEVAPIDAPLPVDSDAVTV